MIQIISLKTDDFGIAMTANAIKVKCENCKHWKKYSHRQDSGDCKAITTISDGAYMHGTKLEDPEIYTHKDFGCALYEIKE